MFKVHKFRRIVKIPHIYTTYPIFQKNVENSAHSKNTITHRIYILLYVQSTHLKKKKKQSKLYTFNVHNFSKNVRISTHSMNIVTQRIYIILYV